MVTKSASASTVHRKRLQVPTIATIDLAMRSGAVGLSNDVVTEVSVDFSMLCYRQFGREVSQSSVNTGVRVALGNPNLEKGFQCAGNAVALNPWRCPLR